MKAFFTLLSFLFSSFVFANNIQLQKVALTDTNRAAQTVNIQMNLSWEHSWRDSINWDAAWIIVKYKEARDSMWKWKHVQLVQSGNNTGSASGVKMVVPDDGTGAFFYRSQIGSGNISSENVKLFWNYGAAGVTNIDSVEVRVFATEMVYVPAGSFCLGDGNGIQRSGNSFQIKNAPNNYAVITNKWTPLINTPGGFSSTFSSVGDDRVLFIDGIRISGLEGVDVNDDKISDYPYFPTGYGGFYCMKYKVTQGQYTDFLNTVSANDTTAFALEDHINYYPGPHNNLANIPSIPKPMKGVWKNLGDYMIDAPSETLRHSIVFNLSQLKFTVNRPDRAHGLMDMNRGLAFSDWFALRPMSELEFEKACRGPLPPSAALLPYEGEKAWGDDNNIPTDWDSRQLAYSGIENGTEYFKDYNITKRKLNPIGNLNGPGAPVTPGASGGDGGMGPYRVGIFATDTSSRISSGASYYGIMDLSKITSEIVFPLSTAINRSFNSNIHGGGVISGLGENYNFKYAIGPIPMTIYKLGSISARGTSPNGIYGFRAVRTAPSDN